MPLIRLLVAIPIVIAALVTSHPTPSNHEAVIASREWHPADTTLTRKQTDEWFRKQEWLGGLKAKPHASIDKEEFSKQYHANKAWWDIGFAYLKNTDFSTVKPGKYPLDGDNVFVNVTEVPTKPLAEGRYESHKDYADIHFLVSGKELISAADITKATVIVPYDDDRDLQFLTAKGKDYVAEPGTFFLFFPKTAHRPGVKTNGADAIKKVVVKIKVAK